MDSVFISPDIRCEGCAATIRKAVGAVDGVAKVVVDVEGKRVTVEHDPSLGRERLSNALRDSGYPEGTVPAAASARAIGADLVEDPVCHMRIRPDESAGTLVHAGVTYHFCARSCLDKFARDPARWLRGSPLVSDAPADATFICPMHPDVRQVGPGLCPLCGMALEPETFSAAEGDDPELTDMTRRFVWAAPLAMVVLVLAMGPMLGLTLVAPETSLWLQFALSTPVVLGAGWPFFVRAWQSVQMLSPNMFTLIAIGTGAAYLYSGVAVLWPGILPESLRHHGQIEVYFEAAAVIIALVLLGQVLELRARKKTGDAIRKLLSLAPPIAHVVDGGAERDVPVAEVPVGAIVRLRPGDKTPLDGVVIDGHSAIDEAMISGESIPVEKTVGDRVLAGTINQTGTLLVRVDRASGDTVLSQIIHLVGQAQRSRVPIQKLADQVAAIFVPAVLATAVATFLAWAWLGPKDSALAHGLVNAVAVLIIACPCALGLATPMSIMVGIGRGASEGVLFKNAETIEAMAKVDVVVVDKTGTLTEGKPQLTKVIAAPGLTENDLLRLAAGAETASEHPIGRAIVRGSQARGLAMPESKGFRAHPGGGVESTVHGAFVLLGHSDFLKERDVSLDASLLRRADEERTNGSTVVHVARDGVHAGLIVVADPIKSTTAETLSWLRSQTIEVVMLTGDDPRTAAAVAGVLGIVAFHARVTPEQKHRFIADLKARGRFTAMAGDGINDAPALAEANVGIAMGVGADVAIEAADVTLVRGDLRGIRRAIQLSRRVLTNIRQNLFFAFFYNVLGVPIAAGILYPWFGILLSPMIAAAAMSLSSVSVIVNALRLARQRL